MSCDVSTQILEIPVLGRQFKLGTLYNARTDEIIPGNPLWSENESKKFEVSRNDGYIYSLIAPGLLSDKFQELNVNGSLQICILTGMVEPKGPASYLIKKKATYRESSVHVKCYCNTAIRQVPANQLEDNKNSFANISKIGRNATATHVVSQIQYGSESTFTLTKRFKDAKDGQKVDDQLAACGSHLLDVLKGNAMASNGTKSDVECHFQADFQLPKNVKAPTTYEEAVKFAGHNKLSQVASDAMGRDASAGNEPLGVPCIIWLYPLVLLPGSEAAPAVKYEINRTLASECVRHVQDYDQVQDRLDDMLKDPLVAKLSPLHGKLTHFREHFNSFREDLNQKLREMVLNIRCGLDTVPSFKKFLIRFGSEGFAFNPKYLLRWMDEKDKELCAMRKFTDQIDTHQLEYTDKVMLFPVTEMLRKQTGKFTVRFAYQLVFASLARPEPFLDMIKDKTLDSDFTNDIPEAPADNNDVNLWCEDKGAIKRIEKEINIFAELIQEKTDAKSFVFAITAPDKYTEPTPADLEVNSEFRIAEFRVIINTDDDDDSDSGSSAVLTRRQIQHYGWDALHAVVRHYPVDKLIDIVRLLSDLEVEKSWDKCNPLLALVRFYTKDNLIDFIRLFLERGIDVNCKDLEGWNALMSLCQCYKHNYTYKLMDVVRLFLDSGIDPNCKTKIGNNALYLLCRNYHKNDLLQIVELFLESGIDVNCRNNDGWNALHFVIEYYHEEDMIEFFRMFIQKGIDVNCKNNDGCNVLLALCRNYGKDNFIDILNLLLGRGIDINCKDRFGENALHYVSTFCCQDYATEIFELLIQSGIDVNCKNDEGWNALLLLCRNYQKDDLITEIVELLVDLGIDVNCKTLDGWNALVALCRYYKRANLIDVAKLLIKQKVNINYTTFDGCNALLHLCRYYQKDNLYDIAKLLLDNGIDVNCKSHAGLNALHLLCHYGTKKNAMETVRLLIERGIDVNWKAKDGCNALIALCRECDKESLPEIVKLLLERGVEVNCKDHEGWNALHFVCRKCPREHLYAVVRLLVIWNIDKSVMTIGMASARSFLLNRYTEEDVKDVIQML
ncbi:uncharacterized protein LOC124208763 [Daphnia pulex]|uniref:uncharacterized protein LOC124208763 n=1 Tax=Daphnia pulex TaxID=6669 RepID=UPI001EE015FC|nr:uncharacterized protein LOC124208763 [Daphnia pulex]